MRVKDLIAILQKQNPEALVLASSDSDGNTISKLSYGISTGEMKGEATLEEIYGLYSLNKEDMTAPEYIIIYPEA